MVNLIQCVCGNQFFLNLPETNRLSDSLECIECGGYWEPNHEYWSEEGDHNEVLNSIEYHNKQWNKRLASKDSGRKLRGNRSSFIPLLKHNPVNLMKKYKHIKEIMECGNPDYESWKPELNMYIRKIKMLLGQDDLDSLTQLGVEKKVRVLSNVKRKSRNTYSNPRYIRAEDRHNIFVRDNYRCVECGADNKSTTLHIDHIIPVSKGGRANIENLQTLCFACNMAKFNRIWED